jgi:hypothetical protein
MRNVALLLLACALSVANADELAERKTRPEPKIPAHTPEWTNPTTGDPGVDSVMDDLQKIVVLCATDHSSPEFKRAWAAYIQKHKLKGNALENTKRRVVDQAFQHRQQFGQTKGDRKDMIEWKKDAEKSVHDTAMSSVRNMK